VRIVPFSHRVLVVALLALAPGAAIATTTITFSGLANVEVVDTDFAALGLDSITTANVAGAAPGLILGPTADDGGSAQSDARG